MSNIFYDTQRSSDTLLGLVDLPLSLGALVTINPATPKIMPMVSSQAPDVGTMPGSAAAFLVIRGIVLANQEDQRTATPNRNADQQTVVVTVPNGGNTQIFQFGGSTSITALGFQSFTAAAASLSIADIQVDANDGIFDEVFLPNGNIGGPGSTLLSLVNQFGPYGWETLRNPLSGGNRVKLQLNNSSGASQTFSMFMQGTKLQANLVQYQVDYEPPGGGPVTNLLTTAIPTKPVPAVYYPLNLRFKQALMDPGSGNYGSIIVSPFTELSSYQSTQFIDINLLASLVYLLPRGL